MYIAARTPRRKIHTKVSLKNACFQSPLGLSTPIIISEYICYVCHPEESFCFLEVEDPGYGSVEGYGDAVVFLVCASASKSWRRPA